MERYPDDQDQVGGETCGGYQRQLRYRWRGRANSCRSWRQRDASAESRSLGGACRSLTAEGRERFAERLCWKIRQRRSSRDQGRPIATSAPAPDKIIGSHSAA
jgi:hypothetical protein